MKEINNYTEKAYRDTQSTFGHLHNATDLSTWLKDTYWHGSIRERRYRTVAEIFLDTQRPLRVLEVAAGVGDFVIFCSKLFPQHIYTANELSEAQLKDNIPKVAKHFQVAVLPQLFFGPAEDLACSDGSFDLIFIKAAVHHFENPQKAFRELYRILKPGGKVVFFEDPIVLNIPGYVQLKKKAFSKAERALGINEHIYTAKEYLSFGKLFARKSWNLDSVLVAEYDLQQEKRTGIKRVLGALIRKSSPLFRAFMIWRFSPIIFVFER